MATVLVAGFEEQLEAQADPQERFAVVDRGADRTDQLAPLQFRHGVSEGTDPGKNELLRLRYLDRITTSAG